MDPRIQMDIAMYEAKKRIQDDRVRLRSLVRMAYDALSSGDPMLQRAAMEKIREEFKAWDAKRI